MKCEWEEVKLGEITLNITDGTHNTIKDDSNGDCFLLYRR